MLKGTRFVVYLLAVLLLGFSPVILSAQITPSFEEQAKLIRIKKIATEWQGSVLTLHTRDGEEVHGRLVKVMAGHFHVQVGVIVVQVPLEDVVTMSFKPGTPEMMLSIISAFMGSAFISGAMILADSDASPAAVSSAAVLGMIGGGLWGYSTFYESEVIHLE